MSEQQWQEEIAYHDKPTSLLERKELIEWVNNLEIPECKQANSSLSFKNGVLFCLIADFIKGGGNANNFLSSVIMDTNDDNASIYNITLACREIAEIWEDFNLNPELVYCDDEEVFRFLKILRDLNFIVQNDTAEIERMNRNSYGGPVELSEESQRESDNFEMNDIQQNQPIDACEEFRVINQENLKHKEESSNNYDSLNEAKDDEINDIREIEEELKRNNMAASNSNFFNSNLEEPSPGNEEIYGCYHNNMINPGTNNQPPPLPRMGIMQSRSHQNFKISDPTKFINDSNMPVPLRDSMASSTPKDYNFALHDQISMFSSQDRGNTYQAPNQMNISDIVEYNRDPVSYPRQPYFVDTLERDNSQCMSGHKAPTVYTEPPAPNYHSFNPEASKTEAGETNAETNNDPNNPFGHDRKNLFSIEDLNSKEDRPLKEIKVQALSQREDSGSRKRHKVKPSDLPMTTYKAQKHKKLIEEGDRYNTDLISADSPMRHMFESKRKPSRRNSKSRKEIIEEFNFFDLHLDHHTQVTLPMLDLVWRREDGTRRKIIEPSRPEDQIIDEIEPPKVHQSKNDALSKNMNHTVSTQRRSRPKRNKPLRTERNNSHRPQRRSLLRPTPVKNNKIVKDAGESEEDIISEMRSLTVRPADRDLEENQMLKTQNTQKTQNTARIRSREIQDDVQVDQVNPKSKIKLLKWLESINLIRKNAVAIQEFPQFCRNGVIFFDLVNKLSGRNQVLKGVHRNPKNVSSINANYAKVLGYLREFPKMNSRYLWSENLMMEGNNDVIWGFIEDIWYWKQNKISPSDQSKRNKRNDINSCLKSDNVNSSFRSASYGVKNYESNEEERTIRIYNEQDPVMNNEYDERSRKVSPETNTAFDHEDIGAYESSTKRDVRHNNIPKAQNNISNISFSHDRFRRNSYSSAKKKKDLSRNSASKKGYSSSKNSLKNLYIVNSSKQSPTFRPNHQSTSSLKRSKRTKKSMKPPRKKNSNMIGKSKDGYPIYSRFALANMTLDYSNDSKIKYQCKRISKAEEEKTKQWLRRINFHSYIPDGTKDLLDDPVRNGILFCELLCFLENIKLFSICFSPKTMKDCRDNIDQAFAICEQIEHLKERIPQNFLANREMVLKGDHANIWGLLDCLRNLYPDILPREHLAYLENTLPYLPKELVALEASLLNWIHSCGALKSYKVPPTSLLEIEEDLKNGTLYCRLVQFIFNIKLPGVFADPKSESTKISNLRKALEVLKKEKSMSQKYTWSEREISKGSREHMIGLLEDMHILFDGYPPRQTGRKYFENGPHLGKVYNQMNRKPFYYHEEKNDTFDLDLESHPDQGEQKEIIKDFLGEARKKKILEKKQMNKTNDLLAGTEGSERNLRMNTSREEEKGINTERPHRKHEQVPSILINQKGQNLGSPVMKIKERNHNFKVSPIRNEREDMSTFIDNEIALSDEKTYHAHKNSHSHNNQMSSKHVSNLCSPESHTFLPNKRITEESMDYTEKSRSEELEELGDITKRAHQDYMDQKNKYNAFRKNPFSIDTTKTDIDPFKEFIDRHKNKLTSRGEKSIFQKMYSDY
ncbi:unnamed protein product [Moneuplotes crassus]|uniref:Calponin-homology (CH) domain-containing protein n=1 Tax=Euplotes crassus TaxID=5936 RepID=A0AAD1X2X8_EUPCR|nr:unnamed protein product [Moneuplotes crassus]